MILDKKKIIAIYISIPVFLLLIIFFNNRQGIKSLSDIKLDMPESAMKSLNPEIKCSAFPRINFKKTQYEFLPAKKGLKYFADCIDGKCTLVNITVPPQGCTRQEAVQLMHTAIPLNKQELVGHDDSDIKLSDVNNPIEHFDFGTIHGDLFYKSSNGSENKISIIKVFTLNAE